MPERFNNIQELINSLNNNNQYYIITKDLWYKIKGKTNITQKTINLSLEDNKIILILNNNNIY